MNMSAISTSVGTHPLQQFEVTLEILANPVYLARREQPGSARQSAYLSRAEKELASLGSDLCQNAPLPSKAKRLVSH